MPERRHNGTFGPGERPRTAPAEPHVPGPADRLETLRELTLAFIQEVDSIEAGESLALNPGVDFFEEVRRFEADLIRWALVRAGGHQRRAARLLNLKANTLNVLIKRHRIRPESFKSEDDNFLP